MEKQHGILLTCCVVTFKMFFFISCCILLFYYLSSQQYNKHYSCMLHCVIYSFVSFWTNYKAPQQSYWQHVHRFSSTGAQLRAELLPEDNGQPPAEAAVTRSESQWRTEGHRHQTVKVNHLACNTAKSLTFRKRSPGSPEGVAHNMHPSRRSF